MTYIIIGIWEFLIRIKRNNLHNSWMQVVFYKFGYPAETNAYDLSLVIGNGLVSSPVYTEI